MSRTRFPMSRTRFPMSRDPLLGLELGRPSGIASRERGGDLWPGEAERCPSGGCRAPDAPQPAEVHQDGVGSL